MSVQAMGWVFENSPAKGAARLTHLALANYAGNDELLAWPAVATIARITNQTERAVQSSLRQLEAEGLIRPHGKRRTGTVVYQLLVGGEPGSPPWVNDAREGVNDVQATPEPGSPEPSFNQKEAVKAKPSAATAAKPKGLPPGGTTQNGPQRRTACPTCDGTYWVENDDRTVSKCLTCHPTAVTA